MKTLLSLTSIKEQMSEDQVETNGQSNNVEAQPHSEQGSAQTDIMSLEQVSKDIEFQIVKWIEIVICIISTFSLIILCDSLGFSLLCAGSAFLLLDVKHLASSYHTCKKETK